MPTFLRKLSSKKGMMPGAVVYTGKPRDAAIAISVIDYDEHGLEEEEKRSPDALRPYIETETVTWVNVDGIHDAEIVRHLGEVFGIHPLVLEDIVSPGQRAKVEPYPGYLFVLMKMIQFGAKQELKVEQVSFIIGPRFVLSFQEEAGDVLEAVRRRIRDSVGRIRRMGTDYLAYALMDAIVDYYYVIIEEIAERIEALEEDVIRQPEEATLQHIHELRQEVAFLRKAVWPLRDVISRLQEEDNDFFLDQTKLFLRDLYDHTMHVIETLDSFRDMLMGLMDLYQSSVSNRMNEVMQVLTIIGSIFIPLTFLAGIYGMNFEHMPELGWDFAYPYAFWAVMITLAGALVFYFQRKGWLR